MCEKTAVECLAAKCVQEPSCTAEGVGSFTYLYARCACVSGPPGLSSRWERVLLGGFVVCLVSRYGLGVAMCTAVLRLRLLKIKSVSPFNLLIYREEAYMSIYIERCLSWPPLVPFKVAQITQMANLWKSLDTENSTVLYHLGRCTF
jgi:hypothetical protein